jgi:hypothetical protein
LRSDRYVCGKGGLGELKTEGAERGSERIKARLSNIRIQPAGATWNARTAAWIGTEDHDLNKVKLFYNFKDTIFYYVSQPNAGSYSAEATIHNLSALRAISSKISISVVT